MKTLQSIRFKSRKRFMFFLFLLTAATGLMAISCEKQHLVSVRTSPSEGGTVEGSGVYAEGTRVAVTAAVNQGYRFINWTEDGVEVTENPSHYFKIASDRTLVANFEQTSAEIIGVIYVIHGGSDTPEKRYLWDAVVQQFSYNPNHAVYKMVIWNKWFWPLVYSPMMTDFADRFLRMYQFEYPRVGGVDPYHDIEERILVDIKTELDKNPDGIIFEVDWAGYLAADRPEHYPHPRFLYNGPDIWRDKLTYCGEWEPDGPWAGCDPERYNVDGPVERLLRRGASQIIAIDTTVGGVRFSKTYGVIEMMKRVLDTWNREQQTSVSFTWINDYTNLMEESYPTEPEGWTNSLGPPIVDPKVSLEGRPNPFAEDERLALLHVEGIEFRFSDTVLDADTAVVLFNHAIHDYNEYFDPKIDDTQILNSNIKSQLLERHPDMNPDNILFTYGGYMVENPENGLIERTREMRGETYGYAWYYESDKKRSGVFLWDALEDLKNRGVQHIVCAFPQLTSDSVLNMVEFYNQIGKEIGIKTWARWGTWDYETYPEVGHPFAEYWGIWVNTDCGDHDCCFTMGGCEDGRPYPPPRQTPLDNKRSDLDPSLGFDMCEYGHLGYDPDLGSPDPNNPVQDQYTGTWDVWETPKDDPRLGALLAEYILKAARGELK